MEESFIMDIAHLVKKLTSSTDDDSLFMGSNRRVLIANSVSAFSNSAIIESFLGRTLAARGWDVGYIFCDRNLDACLNSKFVNLTDENIFLSGAWKDTPKGCVRCINNQKKYFGHAKKIFYFSDYQNYYQTSEINNLIDTNASYEQWKFLGVNIYEHAYSATARFYAKGLPEDEENFSQTLKIYGKAAVKSVQSFQEIINSFSPELIIGHHGIYVPQGPMVDVAKKNAIRIITWTPAYRKGTFIFVEGDSYHKIMPSEKLKIKELNLEQRNRVTEYLQSRREGKNDWIWFHKNQKRPKPTRQYFKIPEDRLVVTAFTNVFWDAQLHFPKSVFANMLEWLDITIDYFDKNEKAHLIIRTHPAEKTGFVPSRQPLEKLLEKKLQNATNVSFIGADDEHSSYDLALDSNFCIVYGSKMSAELSGLGKRVIVAGEAWAKSKGFTDDVSSKKQYIDLLDENLMYQDDLSKTRHNLALTYCYQLFFMNMQLFEFALPTGNKHQPYEIKHHSQKDLLMTQHPSFEKIMSFITKSVSHADRISDRLGERIETLPNFESEALQFQTQIDHSSTIVNSLGLTSHHDSQKDWDTLKALSGIIKNCTNELDLSILDIGTGSKPVILKWLRHFYPKAKLFGCDRESQISRDFKKLNINFKPHDITSTGYHDSKFNFITSISVIEHGVDIELFFKEISRIIKPGGHLFISTDYWEKSIDTSTKFPYAKQFGPMKIFSKLDLIAIIKIASSYKLQLVGKVASFKCKDKPVYWARMDEKYTFAFMAFIKIT